MLLLNHDRFLFGIVQLYHTYANPTAAARFPRLRCVLRPTASYTRPRESGFALAVVGTQGETFADLTTLTMLLEVYGTLNMLRRALYASSVCLFTT